MTSDDWTGLRGGPLPVPSFPTVTAVVRDDGTGEVSISGATFPVHEADMPAARAATIELIVDKAATRVSRPLLVRITDPAGAWVLRVHPDGAVDELEVIPSGAPGAPGAGSHTGGLPVVPDLSVVPSGAARDGDASGPGHEGDASDSARDGDASDSARDVDASVSARDVDASGPGHEGDASDGARAGDASGADAGPDASTDSWTLDRDPMDDVVWDSDPLDAVPGTAPGPVTGQEHVVGAEPAVEPVPDRGRPAAEPSPAPAPSGAAVAPSQSRPAPPPASSDAVTAVRRAPGLDLGGPAAGDAPATARPRTRREARQAPTLTDLIATRPDPQDGPAVLGWQAGVRRLSGGLVAPAPGPRERAQRAAVATVQKPLAGPKTVVVVNPKGGGTKTTSAILLAATFGRHRGGYTLAWDNNETRGTLGWRAQPAAHARTAVDLLRDLDMFSDARRPRVGDLDRYVRSQGDAQFDVLASDEDAASAASIDDEAFGRLHATLSRFYRVIVVDTGNNMRASNWSAAVEAADQLVIVSTVREDTAQSAAWLVDALRATGREQAVEEAVTVLAAPSRTVDAGLRGRLLDHFGQLTRAVLEVPHDESLVAGGPIRYDALAPATRDAWLAVSAAVADGL